MRTQRVKPEPDGDERHPFGRVLSDRWMDVPWLVVLLIAIVVPGLGYQLRSSADVINWSSYLNSLPLMVAVSVATFLVMYILSGRNGSVALRLGASTVLVIFLWPDFARFDSLPLLGTFFVVAVPAFVVFVAGVHGHRLTSTAIILGLAVVVLGTSIYQVSIVRVTEPQIETFESNDGVDVDGYPDVLFILLDGYGREDVLQSFFGFDNSQFLRGLADLGFKVNNGVSSNYNRTYASIASIMDLGYPIESGEAHSDSLGSTRGLLAQGGSLVAAFRDAGYEMTYSENSRWESRCGSPVDYCWRTEVTRTTAYFLSLMSPVAPLVRQTFVHPVNSTSWAQINQLASIVLERTERQTPQLIWAHFILPHSPVNLDESCTQLSDPWRHGLWLTSGDSDDERRRAAFVDQTMCLNETLTEQLDTVLGRNPGMAVFLFSDHGPDGQQQLMTLPDDLTADQIEERYGILLATRMDRQCEAVESVSTLVNGTRLFVGCALGLDIEPIEDRSFIVSDFGNRIPALEIDPGGPDPGNTN